MMQVCRICLRPCGALIKIGRNIVPRMDVSDVIMQFYEFLCEVLIRNDNELFDKMCRKCLVTVRDMYALLDKCEKSTNILMQMKISSVQIRRLSDNFLSKINVKRPRDEDDVESDEIIPPVKMSRIQTNKLNDAVDEDELIEVTVINDDNTETSQDTVISALSNEKSIEKSLISVADDLADVIDFDVIDIDKNESDSNKDNISDLQTSVKTCNLCKISFVKEYYDEHVAKHVENPNEFFINIERTKCLKCPLSYKRISVLADHLTLHGISTTPGCTPIQCEVCLKYFPSLKFLIEHRNKHLELKLYQCRICYKIGLKNCDFVEHLQFHLNDESVQNFKCNQCNETFADKATMRKHEKIFHSKRSHACIYCLKKYNTHIGLQNHIMSKHEAYSLVLCPVCNLVLTQQDELAIHMEAFTEEHDCSMCPLKFGHKNDIEAHKLFHFDGKYSCADCQLAFDTDVILQRHIKTHSTLPFRCQFCKRYIQTEISYRHHLTQHQAHDGSVKETSTSNASQLKMIPINEKTNLPNISERTQCTDVQSNKLDISNASNHKNTSFAETIVNNDESEIKKLEYPDSDATKSDNLIVIADVRSVSKILNPSTIATVQSNRSVSKTSNGTNEQTRVGRNETSLENNVTIQPDVRINSDSDVLEEVIITHIKEESSYEEFNLIVDGKTEINSVRRNVVYRKNNDTRQLDSNLSSSNISNTSIVPTATNTKNTVSIGDHFVITNFQGTTNCSKEPAVSIDLTAVDYDDGPTVSTKATESAALDADLTFTIPKENKQINTVRNQIAKKSTTTLMSALNSIQNTYTSVSGDSDDNAHSSKARISVRRDLMMPPNSVLQSLLQSVPQPADFVAAKTLNNSSSF